MYVVAPSRSVSASRWRSRLCASKNPSSDTMLATMSLRMMLSSGVVVVLTPVERQGRRRIHRSGGRFFFWGTQMIIAARFNGPPGSGNGGYSAGVFAGDGAYEVTLR